jgi:hypothetical protein
MAISSVVKNFRDGTLTFEDGTGSPITLVVQYEEGNFSLSGLQEGLTEINTYLDRGVLGSVRKTNASFPTFSFNAYLTDISDGSDTTLPDLVMKTGAYASAVSTLGANADVMTYKLTWVVEGTNFGDSADHIVILDDCHVMIDMSEGDPDTFSVSGTIFGTITMS